MRNLKFEIALASALTLGAVVSLAAGANASDVMISSAYARASAVPTAKSGAVYMTVMNHGGTQDRLVDIRTDVAKNASLHETVIADGVAKMREIEALDLTPGASAEMAPNGMHIMLTGLKGPLKQGESFQITLVFEKAGEISVTVPVGDVAASGTQDHGTHGASADN
jgi:hypothetical protein